jgi:glutamate-1-semialdehyde 2,1-aminomutase
MSTSAVLETNAASPAARAWSVFPGGSNGEFNLPRELSIVIVRGEGSRLWDSEGREFLDFSLGWGSVLIGHADPRITAAVVRQAPLGSNFAHVTENSLRLAEELSRLSPACERVRFCASGTEATMYCQRLARAARGRMKILKFEGAYHGANEIGVTSLFGAELRDWPAPEPLGEGIGPLVEPHVLVAPFNDLETTRRIVAEYADQMAAVIVEPLHRCLPPQAGFLQGLRALCDEFGVLLLFDEVVTGFRLAYGGAQEYYGVVPDLVAYGKALGGGYSIGAFGGRAEIMEMVAESRLNRDKYVWTASTLGGNPISSAAALATLEILREAGAHDRLHALGEYLRTGMRRVIADASVKAQVIGDGPLAQIVYAEGPLTSSRDLWRGDSARGRATMLGLFARGVFLNPLGTKLYLSLAHDEATCDAFLDRLGDTFQELGR